MKRAIFPAATALLLIASIPAPAVESAPARVFVGYVFARTTDINFRLYTHLCHAFLVADGDGRIRSEGSVPSRALTAEAHKHGVAVLVSLGGWGWDRQFAAIVADRQAEERYFRGVMEIVDQNDYDGIDLDWEYPDTKDEVAGFERLARRFREALDALGREKERPMFLTMAASANPGTLKWLDTAFLVETLDWINVMTYDYAGDWSDRAGHNAPLFASTKRPGQPSSVARTIKYLLDERRLPPDRLTLGIPLYGRGFNVREPYAPTRDAPKKRLPAGNYANLRKLERDPNWTRVWDDQTKTPWLISKKDPAVIGYDDAESITIKTRWATEHGLRGVFFWQVHGDRLPDGSNPLQDAAHHAWKPASHPAEKN